MSAFGLLKYMRNKYSQAGQDGIIEKIFNTLEIDKGHFVEFGAWDGIYLSNCRKLFEEGWSGVFIEADSKKFADLRGNYENAGRVICVHARVEIKGDNTFDKIMSENAPAKQITFLSIDIDGIDLEVFESIEQFLPMVACIEGGQGPHPFDPRMSIDRIHQVGQSLSIFDEVARAKGYRIICCFQDVILVKEENFEKFGIQCDLFEMYINGYIHQMFHIPEFAHRLQKLGRKNRIIDYILERTHYDQYATSKLWLEGRRDQILHILNHLPEDVKNAN